MPTRRNIEVSSRQDGMAYEIAAGAAPHTEGGIYFIANSGDEAIIPDSKHWYLFRTTLNIPKGAALQKATFKTYIVAKNATTFPQSFTYNLNVWPDSPPLPDTATTAAPVRMGPAGHFPPAPGTVVANGRTAQTFNYTANTTAGHTLTVDLTTMIDNVMRRSDYYRGIPVTIIFTPTAENGDLFFKMVDDGFSEVPPELTVTYVEAPHKFTGSSSFPHFGVTDVKQELNLLANATFEKDTRDWHTNTLFGALADGTIIARDAAVSRQPGTYSLKVSAGAAGDKPIGTGTNFRASRGVSYIFNGWVYVPSGADNKNVRPVLHSQSGYDGLSITERGKWVPFCTEPYTAKESGETLLFGVVMDGPVTTNSHFFIDHAGIIESRHKQLPFVGDTAEARTRKHIWVESKWTGSEKKGVSLRTTRPLTSVRPTAKKIVDTVNSTTGWSHYTGDTVNLYYDGTYLRANPDNGYYSWIRYTTPIARSKRYLAVLMGNEFSKVARVGMNTDEEAYEVEQFGELDYSIVKEADAGSGLTWHIIDLGDPVGQVTYIELEIEEWYGQTPEPELIVGEIAEVDQPTMSTATMKPATRWVRNQYGIWQRADSERQSVAFEDTESTAQHAMAGQTMQDLANKLKSWDEMEGL